MAKLPLLSLFQIILDKKSALRFLIGTIFSLSFSVGVILATIGLMDGYSVTLKKALANSNGDIKLKARNGFFTAEFIQENLKEFSEIKIFTPILQVEAFALAGGESKGVLVKGVEANDFSQTTGINLSQLRDGIAIGKEYASQYDLKIGDTLVLALRSNKAQAGAILQEFKIDQIVKHGIYEKDFRFIYYSKEKLVELLGFRPMTSNLGLVKLQPTIDLEFTVSKLSQRFKRDFIFEPYWSEHEVLLDAVEIERDTISIALQLIVLVSVINIIAFMIFISEVKSQDIFMLRALGLSMKSFRKFWFFVMGLIWIVSSLLGIVFMFIVDKVLLRLPFLQLPGDIYKLTELNILLTSKDYGLVLGLSLVWIFAVGYLTMRRIQSKPLLSGLREEFS